MSDALPYHTMACPTCDGTGKRTEDCQADPEHDADIVCDECPEPIPCAGRQGLWDVPEDIVRRLP